MSSFIWLPLTKKGGEKSSEELKAAFAKKGCKPSQTKPHWPSPGPRLAAAVKQKDWSVRGFPHWLPPAVCRHFRQLKQTQLPQFGIPSNSIYSFFHCLFIFLLLLIPSTPPFSPCVYYLSDCLFIQLNSIKLLTELPAHLPALLGVLERECVSVDKSGFHYFGCISIVANLVAPMELPMERPSSL